MTGFDPMQGRYWYIAHGVKRWADTDEEIAHATNNEMEPQP